MDNHLTRPQGEEMAAMQAKTTHGMAHWAGSGPDGAECRMCKFLVNSAKRFRRSAGRLDPRRCQKYAMLMRSATGGENVHGSTIEPDTAACRYFSAHDNPPSLMAHKKCGA